MRVEWHAPVTLHLYPDVIDPRASQLRRSADGDVQLLVGADVAVLVWLKDAGAPVSARIGEVIGGVTSIELDDEVDIGDDTVVRNDGIFAAGDASVASVTHSGNDDDTILSQPALARREDSPADTDDQTILGQPPTMGDVIDDPDASADTIIGPRRSRPESPADAHSPASTPGSPVLSPAPPALPTIPSIPASAHIGVGGASTASRRTRIETPEASGAASGTLAVAFPDGRTVALDRAIYVGRSPKSPRITSGLVPELVSVPSPRREVSSTHLEIQQEGRAVVVRDLGSTNGTRLRAPGAAPSLLSPGATRVVAAGTLLDLGDDVVLEIVERPGRLPVAPTEVASW